MTTSAQQTVAALREQLANGSLAGRWTLDPAQSTAMLHTKSMWGLAPVKGVFREVEGSGKVSPTGEVTGRIALATGALDTKNARRDTHLRSADFFLSEKYPAIIFGLRQAQLASLLMFVIAVIAIPLLIRRARAAGAVLDAEPVGRA